jgi:hypothetical protein
VFEDLDFAPCGVTDIKITSLLNCVSLSDCSETSLRHTVVRSVPAASISRTTGLIYQADRTVNLAFSHELVGPFLIGDLNRN